MDSRHEKCSELTIHMPAKVGRAGVIFNTDVGVYLSPMYRSLSRIKALSQKTSHNQESLIRIKTASEATFFVKFEYKMSTRILKVCITNSMCDLICDLSVSVFKALIPVQSMNMRKS